MRKPVAWLVIGIGDIARKRVIPAILAEPRSTLLRGGDARFEKGGPIPGNPRLDGAQRRMGDSSIDAVYVASPVALDAPHTIACLRAGKHVLCEKPVALNYSKAKSMVAEASDTRRLFGVAYYRRLFPKLIRAKALIAEGAIGQPVLAEANSHAWLNNQDRGWLVDPAMAAGGPLYDTTSP